MPTKADATRDEIKQRALAAIEERKDEIIGVAQDILRNPETGWNETRTSGVAREWFQRLGIPYRDGIALTGVKGHMEGGAGPGPSVGLLGELDSLRVPEHPFADPTTGAAHACGHHVQMGSMLGALVGFKAPGVMDSLAGTLVPFAVPAEEFIEVEKRLAMRDQGKIEFLGGKQELIKLDEFNDIDMAVRMHTGNLDEPLRMSVGGTCNGHVVKFVRFIGRGAHAGSAPHLGINALNAAMLAIQAMNANRETFRDADMVRFHGIINRGGDAVSAVPSDVRLEWRVRAGSIEAVRENNAKLDRSFKAGALAVGAQVKITTIPGYFPIRNDQTLKGVFIRNAEAVVGEQALQVVSEDVNRGHSSDLGDLSYIMPVLGFNVGGVTGVGHGKDYVVEDWDNTVINTAKVYAAMIIDLMYGDAASAKEVIAKARPEMTRNQYLTFQREQAAQIDFDGATE